MRRHEEGPSGLNGFGEGSTGVLVATPSDKRGLIGELVTRFCYEIMNEYWIG